MSTCNNVRPGLRNGSKTGLCAHIFRLLRGRRVPWVLLENVPGLLMWHMNDDPPQPPAVSYVVAELESLGYRWAQRVVGLTGFGLPQRRRRVFILASTHGDPRDALLAPQAVCLGQCIELFKRDASAAANQFGVSDRMCAECALAGAYDRDPPRPAEATAVDIERNQKRVGLASRKCSERALARCVCNHPPRECYDCFWTPPFVEPRRTLACADLAEKRHGPLLHELFTLTTANGKRMAVVEDLGGGKGSACMLHVEDAERIMGFPAGWTEPCYPLNRPGVPPRQAADADVDASVAKRMSLLGIAVAPPQSRWIGERLANPYDLKFARDGDGVRFTMPCPGGPNASIGGARVDPRRVSRGVKDGKAGAVGKPAPVSDVVTEARWAASGWPDACWNMLHAPVVFGTARCGDAPVGDAPGVGDAWRGRRALPDCSDAPVLRGFVPLGEFIRRFDRRVNREQAAGYLERLALEHVDVEPFITRGLGGRVSNAVLAARRAKAKEEKAADDNDDATNTPAALLGQPVCDANEESDGEDAVERAGRVCWVPVKLRGFDAFWPACALHPDDDRDVIPTDALNARTDDVCAETHAFVVYFGDATYEWREREDCVDYDCDAADGLRRQPRVAGRARFRKAIAEADAWFASQLRARDTPATRAARAARDREEEYLRRAAGAPAEASACGGCKVCRSNALAATEIPFSSRHRPRAAAAPATLKPLRGVKPDERCPRLEIIVAARDGHVGANLALLGDRAVGRRVRVHWPNERDCFRGVVSGFDRETWLHSLEYDDGDVEPAIRLWREVVHLGVPEDERADREEATREARRGKVDAAGTGADAAANAAAEVGEDISAKGDGDRQFVPATLDRRSSRKRGATEIAVRGDPGGGRGGRGGRPRRGSK